MSYGSESEPESETSGLTSLSVVDDSTLNVIEQPQNRSPLLESRSQDGSIKDFGIDSPTVSPRAYQLEMLEASLKKNVIVSVCSVSYLSTSGKK